jgi:cyanophycinase
MLRRLIPTVLFFLTSHATAAEDYQYYVSGNPDDVVTETQELLVLQGGGTDVDENYIRMGELSGGGDFLVLRASGDDGYNDYIYALCKCDSVETIVFENRDAAHDEFVIEKIRNAEALFIAGGDQSRYVRFWKGTPIEDAIHFVAAKPAPLGGTSAGMENLITDQHLVERDRIGRTVALLARLVNDGLTTEGRAI